LVVVIDCCAQDAASKASRGMIALINIDLTFYWLICNTGCVGFRILFPDALSGVYAIYTTNRFIK
jgi:hypothetical protein